MNRTQSSHPVLNVTVWIAQLLVGAPFVLFGGMKLGRELINPTLAVGAARHQV